MHLMSTNEQSHASTIEPRFWQKYAPSTSPIASAHLDKIAERGCNQRNLGVDYLPEEAAAVQIRAVPISPISCNDLYHSEAHKDIALYVSSRSAIPPPSCFLNVDDR